MTMVSHTKHQHKRLTQHIHLHTALHTTQHRASQITCFEAHIGKLLSKPATRPWEGPFLTIRFRKIRRVATPCSGGLFFLFGQGLPRIIFLIFFKRETIHFPPRGSLGLEGPSEIWPVGGAWGKNLTEICRIADRKFRYRKLDSPPWGMGFAWDPIWSLTCLLSHI